MKKVLAFLLFCVAHLSSYQTAHILAIHSYSEQYPWTAGQYKGFLETLSGEPLEISTEYLETKHIAFTSEYQTFFAKYLQKKYANYTPQIIYATDDNALSFLMEFKNELFPDAKVVFSGVNNLSLENKLDKKIYRGIFEKKEPQNNIAIVKKSFPNLNKIYFLGDGSSTDEAIMQELKSIVKSSSEFSYDFISTKEINIAKQRLLELEPSVVILTTIGQFQNSDGATLGIKNVLREITQQNKHIVMVMEDAYVQEGVLGGYVTSSTNQGKLAGELVKNLLNGNDFKEESLSKMSANLYMFDKQVLKKYNLKLSEEIYSNAIIVHDDPSFWDNYKTALQILFIVVVVIFIAGLSISLIIYKRKNSIIQNTAKNLQELHQKLNNAQLSAKLGSWEFDFTKKELFCSDEIYNIFEMNKEEVTPSYKAFLEFVHPEDLNLVEEVFEDSLKNQKTYSIDHRLLFDDGRVKYVKEQVAILCADNGTALKLLGTVQDITERVVVEEEFKAIFQTSKDPIALIDMQSNFIRVNKAYCDLTGYSEEELLQKSCIGMSVPEDVERAKQALQIILQAGFIENFEKSCFSKDGSRFTINMSVALMPDKEKMLLTTKNITKEVQLRNALNNKDKEQNILLSLFDKGEANLFKWNNDVEWSIEYASENVGSLLGFTKEEFMSKSVVYASCIHQEDLPRVIGEVQNAVEKNADFFKHQPYRIITKDKKVKWVLDYTVTQKNEEDEITHFIGYITDITEQKLYEEQLKAAKIEADLANESKSQFLASMSHEIRTPMNGILGFLEQLAKTETDPERVKKFDVIKNSGEQLLHIINDILDFSKIESGKMDIDLHPCSLSDLMQNSVNIFSEISSKKNISLTLLLDDTVPQCIMADKTRLQQVVFNLLSNAIKFTPNGGEIVLETKYNSALQSVLINVKDNGIGIANDKLQSIFEAFVQEDKSTTRKFGGTGLGLSISSSLVHLMNSQLQVKSTLGQGSEFYFELPLGVCSDDTISPKVQKESKSRTKEEVHVLVVEDNKTNQMLMGMILDDLEITYDMAIDGVEAIKKFKEKTYDIILMDENMPNMNGIEATKHIREIESNHALQHTPIVAVTANALSGDKEKFLSLGMDDYVAKPYSQEDIERVLYRFV